MPRLGKPRHLRWVVGQRSALSKWLPNLA